MKVLVTGGSGFLGRHIVQLCLEREWSVRSLQRHHSEELKEWGVEQFIAPLDRKETVREAVLGCDAVFHVAAKAGIWGSRASFEAANVEGTQNVIEACTGQGVQRLVYTSTPSVVFNGGAFQGADESLPYGTKFLCHYAETKARAEAMVLAAHDPVSFHTCALRPHLIWGVGDPHLLPRVVDAARAGRLRIVGDGTNKVDITHVRNAAEAHLQALDALCDGRAGRHAYFLSQGRPVELWPWINGILSDLGIDPVEKKIPLRRAYFLGAIMEGIWKTFRRPGEPPMTRFVAIELAKSHWFSIEAARRAFGYTPERHLTKAGVREFVAHMKAGNGTNATPVV